MTATWRSRDELVHQIVTLAADGMSRRAITRAVGVSRNTVKAVLAAHAVQRTAPHSVLPAPAAQAPRPKKTDAFRGRISELFVRYPDITARRVFEILLRRLDRWKRDLGLRRCTHFVHHRSLARAMDLFRGSGSSKQARYLPVSFLLRFFGEFEVLCSCIAFPVVRGL